MPVTRSASKNLRKATRRAGRNALVHARLHYLLKRARKALSEGVQADAQLRVAETLRAYDKAGQNGVVPKNAVSRMKSRLTRRLNALGPAKKA